MRRSDYPSRSYPQMFRIPMRCPGNTLMHTLPTPSVRGFALWLVKDRKRTLVDPNESKAPPNAVYRLQQCGRQSDTVNALMDARNLEDKEQNESRERYPLPHGEVGQNSQNAQDSEDDGCIARGAIRELSYRTGHEDITSAPAASCD